MTMRLSWLLALGALLLLILLVGGLGLFLLDRATHTIAELAPHAGAFGSEREQAFAMLADRARLALFGALGLAVLTVVVVLWGVTANVLRPLERVVAGFDAMAYGDLSVPLERLGNNEIGQLCAAVQGLQQRLSRTLALVRLSSDNVYRGARHIASGNNAFSARTEQQVARLKKTAARMETLSATVKQNAEHARHASRLVREATRTAGAGSEVINELVSTMRELSQSSRQISEIIEIIDTIAHQTNLLAINASVEAGRAGEQGQGFALVAGEVRGLAGRSADAAKEIRALVETSTARVEAGTARVDKAGETIGEIVSAVHQVNRLVDEIASASQAQSQGIEQVNRAIAQMDQVTQRNADLVREDAKAADQVEAEAERLRKAVAVFRLAPEVEARFADNHFDEAAAWMASMTPDDLAHRAGARPRRRAA
ncbi:MAG: methyl-accepting chemotaxis protein [Halochromatium sp.]|uniref:methyl-accepting chemotaxis protein n=1 Tax=Halochromatium sp. TaxID=2049430 RepID=UPI00397C678D